MLSWPEDLGYRRSPAVRAIVECGKQRNPTNPSTWRPGQSRSVKKGHVPHLSVPQGTYTVMLLESSLGW
jgi:hypothetical protein